MEMAISAGVSVMRLLSEQIYQLDIPGNVAELGVFRGEFSSLISAAFPDRKIHLFDRSAQIKDA